LDRRAGLRARVLRCTAPPQAFWRSPGMARWLTKCAGDKNNQQRNRTALSCPAAQSTPARHLFVRPFFSLPARHMARCLSMDLSPSRAALPCTFAALTRPHGPHTINPIHSSPRPGRGCVEDLLKRRYMGGRGLQTTNLPGCMIGQAQRPRYVVIVFLYCPTPLSRSLSRHAHLRCTTFTTPLPLHIHDLTILLCTTSLSCWHGFPVTIVIHHNHQRDPASRYSTFFLPTSYFVQQHLNTIAQPRHRLAVPKTHAEHPPRHT